jgi:hypothetical protein
MSLNGKHCVLFRTRMSAIRPSSKRRVYISTPLSCSISILCLLFIPCCGRATWEIWGRRGVLNPLSFSMSPILRFIRLPVVVEVVSRVTGPRPGNFLIGQAVLFNGNLTELYSMRTPPTRHAGKRFHGLHACKNTKNGKGGRLSHEWPGPKLHGGPF